MQQICYKLRIFDSAVIISIRMSRRMPQPTYFCFTFALLIYSYAVYLVVSDHLQYGFDA